MNITRRHSMMFPPICRLIFPFGVMGLMQPSVVEADQIVTEAQNHPDAGIVRLEGGRLQFRDRAGQLQSAWIHRIGLIVMDRAGAFTDFNQAERFLAGGEPARAIPRYRRAMRLLDDFWPELIAARLTTACDQAEQVDQAVSNLLIVLEGFFTGPPAAARLIPRRIPSDPDGKVLRALDQLNAVLTRELPESHRTLLTLVRYEMLGRIGDERVRSAAKEVAVLPIPADIRSERVYQIQHEALGRVLQEGVNPDALAGLDRAIRDAPESLLPDFLLLKGWMSLRAAASREDILRASWPFLRAAIHFPDDERAAEGLYGAASALERAGLTDQAVELLTECLESERLGDKTRRQAESALKRLREREQDDYP